MSLSRQKVHAVLRKAGFTKSRTATTSIKGWHQRYEGYDIREDDETIRVQHRGDFHFLSTAVRHERITKQVGKYFLALAEFDPALDTSDGYYGPAVVLRKQQ